jgi:hypothetical protein
MAMKDREEKKLGRLSAIWHAFRAQDVGHYPRFVDDAGRERQITDEDVIRRIASRLSRLKDYRADEIEFYLERGRESLNEVKGLTEYEDQKATRNLTIITFLSALAGVLFSRFADSYPLRSVIDDAGIASIDSVLVAANYLLFFVFAVCAVSGALIVFHATRIRFKYPKLTTLTLHENKEQVKSYLFYSPIIQVLPERWAESFLDDTEIGADAESKLRQGLGTSYFKNYIVESYLVATKVADKLRYLMPAQDILSWSIRALLVWLFVYGLASALVPVHDKDGTAAPTATATPLTAGQGHGAVPSPPVETTPSAESEPGG